MRKQKITQSQKMMLFILAMTVYGIACLFSELIPKFRIGVFELSIKYFLFIPLSLAMLFEPLSVALGASTGKIVFGSMMLGKFKGLGSFKKFFTVTIGVYIAGRMVRNPKNKRLVAIAAITGTAVQLLLGVVIDIALFNLAVDDFDAIPGLPESVYTVRGFEAVNDLLFTGILFCLIPTVYMVPKLHGKIEPLMGLKPRDEKTAPGGEKILTAKVLFLCILGFVAAFGTNYLSAIGINLIGDGNNLLSNTIFVSAMTAVPVAAAIFLWANQPKVKKNSHE
jgi:hypothetical protein